MKNGARTILLPLGDIVMLVIAFFIMLQLAFYGHISSNIIYGHLYPFMIVFFIWIFTFFLFNLYDTESIKPTIPHLQKIGFASIVAFAASIILFYLIPFFGIAPKSNLAIFSGVFMLLFLIWRRIFYNFFSSYFRKSTIFIASDKNSDIHIDNLITYISANPQSGFNVYGKYNSIEEFLKVKLYTPQVFIVTKDVWKKSENLKKLYNTKSLILDLPQAYEEVLGRIPVEIIDEDWFIHKINSHQEKIYNVGKRILGSMIAGLILILTSPMFILASFFIKIYDGGPIFYSQNRVGKNGKNFRLYKFRSMSVDAEKNGPEWATKKDARVTPVGKVIRKLHFDEIPQMWNVIKGDLALVGPRPERPEFVEELEKKIPFYDLRHIISPGFTGWAQIKFRYAGSVMDSKTKFEYDLYYLKNRNFFMDFGIILRTIQIIFIY